jgi:hypothetical protein
LIAVENDPISLQKLIGTDILAKIPAFKGNTLITLRLVSVEAGGIWVESQDFMEDMFSETEHTMTPKSFLLFLPFAQILAIYVMAESPWISRRVAE